ncbi:MAG: glutamate--tRNA ligase [Steroidobacteraceae bacterium]|nr:glutamate--tRNA ligase [Steroidobacteraceae bacterium]
MATVVTRFAPSPSGALHLGNVRTALFSWLLARRAGGRFVLRVEDTDRERSSDESVAGQLADLAWLGLDWDAGPDRDDGRGPYRQSQRGATYARLLAQLEAAGHAYPCYCSPAELEAARRAQLARHEPPRYAGTCRGLDAAARAAREAAGRRPALRFAVPEGRIVRFDDLVRGPQEADAAAFGDFVIRRADGAAMFFFCNAADDALMGVTHVLRGDDHLSNTPRQLLLLEALGLTAPRYGHLPLLLDADGAPQSKRRGSVTVGALRRQGYLPGAVLNFLLRLGHHGAPDAWIDPAELAGHFDPGKLGRAPAHFDPVQLDHWQREAVRRLSPAQAAEWLAPMLPADWTAARRVEAARLLQGNLLRPADAAGWVGVLGGDIAPLAGEDAALVAAAGAGFFESALAAFADSGGDLRRLAEGLQARTGRKGREIYQPLRIALTGRHDGPELAALLAAIPPALVRERLANAARAR